MQRLLACVLFFAAPLVQHAQSVCDLSISGLVIDEHDGSILPFADVQIVGQNKGTISDADGKYILTAVCAGKVILACSHVGCETVYDTIYITESVAHNFYPEHHSEMLNAVSIEAETGRSMETSIVQIAPHLDRSLGSTLGESLKGITGVNSLNTGGSISKPMIHGLHSNRLLVLNNGVRQEGQQWGNEHAPEIDPFIAGEVAVIKGASSIQYGADAIAGVVLVSPKPLPDSFGLAGGFNLVGQSNGQMVNSSLFLEGRNERLKAFRWRTQGSVKKGGNQTTPDYFLKNTGIEEWNFSGAVSLSDKRKGAEIYYSQFNTNLGIFSASHIGNLTDLQRAFQANEPLESSGFNYEIKTPYQHVTHELIKASGFLATGEKGKFQVTYAHQYNLREEFDKHSVDQSVPALSFEITTHSADALWEYRHGIGSKLKIGASTMAQGNTFSGRFFIPNFKKWSTGFFAIEQWKMSNRWTLEAGARWEYVNQLVFIRKGAEVNQFQHAYHQPTGSIGILKSFRSDWQWRTNLATAWRPPNVNELYSNGLHHGAATFEIGDTSLVREVSYSWNSELSFKRKRVEAQVEIYVNYMDHFINLQPVFPATLTIRGAFPSYQFVQVNALLYGVDSKIAFDILPALKVTSKTSILRARNLDNQDWLSQMPADQSQLELEYSFLKLRKNRTAFAAIDALWVNKQWRVPANSDYVSSPSAFLLFGMTAGMNLPVKSGEIGINLEINNLLNQRYRNYLNRYRYYADEIGQNIILRLSATF
jgi:iron complex outermembrane recepter protein